MDVPPADHPVWRQILTGGVRYRLDFFAAKILLGWLLLKVDSDPGEEMVAECARALHHLFAQNAQLPCVQHDLAEILHDGVAVGDVAVGDVAVGDGAAEDWPLPDGAGATAVKHVPTPQPVKEVSQ